MKYLLLLALIPALCSAEEALTDKYAEPYLNPGMVALKEDAWVGSDQMLNLSNNIEVYTEIVMPAHLQLPLTEREIDDRIKEAFKKSGITPYADFSKTKAPLPLFHLLIMVYPLKDQYIAYVDGRLFESVQVSRVKLDHGSTLQAITWENQNLIKSSIDDFKTEVLKSVDGIIETFVERYKYFRSLSK